MTRLLNILKDLKGHVERGTVPYDSGNKKFSICKYVWHEHDRVHEPDLNRRHDEQTLNRVFRRWPEYSGDEAYPIAASGMTERLAFYSLPRWSGPYGEARKRLLDFTIAELEKEAGQ